jgi:hypothetical protein
VIRRRWIPASLLAGASVLLTSCAATDSARYVQAREVQANLARRTSEALDAGLIDAATAKRVLAISEAVSEQAEEYRKALAEGRPRDRVVALLDLMESLLDRADALLRGTGEGSP